MRLQGFERFEERWVAAPEVRAREGVQAAARVAGRPFAVHVARDAVVAGTVPETLLVEIGQGLERGRDWFGELYAVEPGLGLFGGRMAEIYVFGGDGAPYQSTVDHFGSLTKSVPPGWAEAVKKSHGFMWWDPYPLSSAREWNRAPVDLAGHSYHHWGHLLVNRAGYNLSLIHI